MEPSSEIPRSPDDVPGRHVTVNQVIGYNITRWRKAAKLTQDVLGERMGWSNATVSAAERSWDGKRIRQFTGDEIASLAVALGVPLPAMFFPPDDDGANVRYLFEVQDRDAGCLGMRDLFELLLPDGPTAREIGTEWRDIFAATESRFRSMDRGDQMAEALGDLSEQERQYELAALRHEREAMLNSIARYDALALALERKGRA